MRNEYWISPSLDVYYNLALEEYLVRNLDFNDRNLLLIYRNQPCVVLGKNQNILKEINYQFYLENNFDVARRISGGGTVVHDEGNINFAFFERHDFSKVNSYESSSNEIAKAIQRLGIECYLNERNAIILKNGKKISGSAQFSSTNAILSHLTLLYESNLDWIRQILKPNPYSISTKASQSVPSPIDNLKRYYMKSLDEFISELMNEMGRTLLSPSWNEDEIIKLRNEKYHTLQFYYDLACNGILQTPNIQIELELGKIKGLSEMKDYFYIGKRLLYEELSPNDILWHFIFQ